MQLAPLDGLERRQILHYTALKNQNANEIRWRMEAGPVGPLTRNYINAYADGNGRFYRYEAARSAYYQTLYNDGNAMTDDELMALPEPPAWLDDRSIPVPPESASNDAWAKYVRRHDPAHVPGPQPASAYPAGLKALIAAVRAGNAQP